MDKSRLPRTFATIDLGSNALRAGIYRYQNDQIIPLYALRDPLRLGEDVFKVGHITPKKIALLEEAFIKLLHLFAEYRVTEVRAYTTSAMREASNRQEIINHLFHITGIKLKIITGEQEAFLVFRAVKHLIPFKNKNVVILDLGGGSTEIIVINKNGTIRSRSFAVGTVRLLEHTRLNQIEQRILGDVETMSAFIHKHLPEKKIDLFVGTGGNLRRFGKMRKKIFKKNDKICTRQEIRHIAQTLKNMNLIDRIRKLELDSNRADVILPASLLISKLMKKIHSEKIILPPVGLKEGMALHMFRKENPTLLQI